MGHQSFTRLDVYRKCRLFRKAVSKLSKSHFPKEEKYLLTSLILRSSRLVTANIAEGNGRFYYMETVKFCRNAKGSLDETMEHLITAFDEEYISKEMLREMKTLYDSCNKALNDEIQELKKVKRGNDDPINQ